jgi:hypothetical protein
MAQQAGTGAATAAAAAAAAAAAGQGGAPISIKKRDCLKVPMSYTFQWKCVCLPNTKSIGYGFLVKIDVFVV